MIYIFTALFSILSTPSFADSNRKFYICRSEAKMPVYLNHAVERKINNGVAKEKMLEIPTEEYSYFVNEVQGEYIKGLPSYNVESKIWRWLPRRHF